MNLFANGWDRYATANLLVVFELPLGQIVQGMKLGNFIGGQWVNGDGDGQALFNAVNGEMIATASTRGLDFGAILDYGRKMGNPVLRKMTFHERGRMLR